MIWVRKLMGWVLVGLAVHFLRPLLPGSWGIILLGLIALAAGVHLAFLDRTTASFRAFPWLKSGAWFAGLLIAMVLVGSWALQGPGVSWQPYSENVLAEAKQLHKPVIMDFTATWCSPCRELEEITFHHPEIVKKTAQEFVMVRVDLTQKGDPNSPLAAAIHDQGRAYRSLSGCPGTGNHRPAAGGLSPPGSFSAQNECRLKNLNPKQEELC